MWGPRSSCDFDRKLAQPSLTKSSQSFFKTFVLIRSRTKATSPAAPNAIEPA